MQLYEAFHLVQSSRRKLKGVRERGLKARPQKRFFYFRLFKNRNICHVLHWIWTTGKNFIKIWAR